MRHASRRKIRIRRRIARSSVYGLRPPAAKKAARLLALSSDGTVGRPRDRWHLRPRRMGSHRPDLGDRHLRLLRERAGDQFTGNVIIRATIEYDEATDSSPPATPSPVRWQMAPIVFGDPSSSRQPSPACRCRDQRWRGRADRRPSTVRLPPPRPPRLPRDIRTGAAMGRPRSRSRRQA